MDDVPAVTVKFSQGSYTVAEGATQSVTVTGTPSAPWGPYHHG